MSQDPSATNNSSERAILGNGCFWCTEAVFQQLKGVQQVRSGYSGGNTLNPDYKSVCSGTTGHAECLEIIYDGQLLSYEELLEVFWKTHDPTTLNRQGNDVGTQYRSVIFYLNDTQKAIAASYIKQLNDDNVYGKQVVTSLEPFETFYPAEGYHQDYFNLNGSAPYCQFVVRPKVEKFKKAFPDKLKNS